MLVSSGPSPLVAAQAVRLGETSLAVRKGEKEQQEKAGTRRTHPSILIYCLELSELVVKCFADVDATSSTLHVLDCLGKGHAQAFHYLDSRKQRQSEMAQVQSSPPEKGRQGEGIAKARTDTHTTIRV